MQLKYIAVNRDGFGKWKMLIKLGGNVMALENIDKMPQSTFDEIVEKYVKPFEERKRMRQRINRIKRIIK